MAAGQDGRKRVDLLGLPTWAKTLVAVATVLLVAGLALLTGSPSSGAVVPVSAIIAAVVAFAFVAWRAARRR